MTKKDFIFTLKITVLATAVLVVYVLFNYFQGFSLR